MAAIAAPARRVSTINVQKDIVIADGGDVLQKYAQYKNQAKGHDPVEAKRKSICKKLRRNCHFAAFKGDLGFVRKALNEIPTLITEVFNYMEQSLMSPAEDNDTYYLPPAQVPKLVRAALLVGNPAHMTVDQRWLLTHSFAQSTLLHYACAGDQLLVVRFLIEQGADRNTTNLANREPDYYTLDEKIREYLWTSPVHQHADASGTAVIQARPKRLSVFNGGGAVAVVVENTEEEEETPCPVYTIPTEYMVPSETQVHAQQPPRLPPQHRPSTIMNMFSEPPELSTTGSRAPPPPAPPVHHRGPPPPPPPVVIPHTMPTRTSVLSLAPPRALPPPPTGRNPSVLMPGPPPPSVDALNVPGNRTSISRLIERTRKSIRLEEEAATEALSSVTPFSEPRPSESIEAKPRPSISKRRLSRVIQSRNHRDSRTGQEGNGGDVEETEKELPMLELPSPRTSFSRPLVMKRLSVQGGGLRETTFQVDDEGGLTECAQQSRVASDDETDRVSSPLKPAPSRGVLSKTAVSLRDVEESVQYLEAWEGKVAARNNVGDAGDTMSIIKAAMYDPSNGLEGARAAASLFARAKKVEREEAHKASKRQSVMRIYKIMPPMESVASQMIKQHSTGLTAMQILFKSGANNDQSVLDTYQAALDAALDESANSDADSDEDDWGSNGASIARKRRKPPVDMTKLSYREMIWCKAGMGMNISDATSNVGDDARLRSSAYKQGVRIMKKEFKGYAFRDHWEALAFYERKSVLMHQLKGNEGPSAKETESRRSLHVVDKGKKIEPVECASTAENSDADSQQMEGLVAALGGARVDSDEEWAD